MPQGGVEDGEPTARHGTRITFTPDPTIFSNPELAFEVVDARLRELALLNEHLRTELRDERRRRRTHQHPKGVRGFLEDPTAAFVCRGTSGEVTVDAALRWGSKPWAPFDAKSFANNEPTTEHGTHLDGLIRGVADVVYPDLPMRRRHGNRARQALSRS